ncbi:2-hydroxymuconate tautomerase [Weissella halotolerans]|uniref:4-oxalocrotonate tautomerase-like domain-containing protein n=1 Tax=Weissella halotolerans DSM 20190 TaxID=1123500 RepID=A0A0R2G2V5_9LACO|nr:2-hydroxymuconate tautomerase [Weissella halotolerans]KRN31708.1 hypothetical protein IV68_GL000964 [Weissella halotolerans DSM 20190]
MPMVHVELVAGRTPEQLRAMMNEITNAVETNIGVPREAIKVVVTEMQPDHYMDGGILRSDN